MSRQKSWLLVVLMIVGYLLFSTAVSDEGTDDPDFDYEPPEQISSFQRFTTFMVRFFSSADHPDSFGVAKKRLFRDIRDSESLYCGCSTDVDARTFDADSCGYVPKNDNDRAHRLEAEHVLPAFWIAKFHDGETCWVKDESCGSARECCLKNDERFRTAHNDLVNLIPSIGELNAARSNLIYDLIDGESREYGACDFEVDTDVDTTEPRDEIRGDVARIYFYMSETYKLIYPDDLTVLLEGWDAEDGISQAEIDRNERIQDSQGSSNHFVSTP